MRSSHWGKWAVCTAHAGPPNRSPKRTPPTQSRSALPGVSYVLDDVQRLLPALLHSPLPSLTDSACIAGLLDLLRTRGLWTASVRYGYVFGVLAGAEDITVALDRGQLWGASLLQRVARIFEAEWEALVVSETRVETGAAADSTQDATPPNACAGATVAAAATTTSTTTTTTAGLPPSTPSLDDAERGSAGASYVCSPITPRPPPLTHVGGGHEPPTPTVQSPFTPTTQSPIKRKGSSGLGAEEGDSFLRGKSTQEARAATQMLEALRARVLAQLEAQTDLCREIHELASSGKMITKLLEQLVDVATNAFFRNDLLMAGRMLLEGAVGSFGLVLSHSLDVRARAHESAWHRASCAAARD